MGRTGDLPGQARTAAATYEAYTVDCIVCLYLAFALPTGCKNYFAPTLDGRWHPAPTPHVAPTRRTGSIKRFLLAHGFSY